MNLKTTFFLLLLLVGGATGWYMLTARVPEAAASPTLEFLDKKLRPDTLTRIEIEPKGQPPVILEKTGQEWSLPGKWPVRSVEVKELVHTLTNLHSRFTPQLADKTTNLAKFGLGDNALSLKLTVAGKTVGLKIGEETSDDNRFSRATYLKLDDSNEIVRLGPGIVAALDRPMEYFQQRRLFPVARVAKDDESTEKIDQVVADEIRVKGPDTDVTVSKQKDGWLIDAPVKDHADPDKVRMVQAGLLDLWADRFVSGKSKTLDEMGLTEPEYTVKIKRPDGETVTLLIGKVSSSKDRVITKPAPPQQSPFMPPGKPTVQIIKEEYRYAKIPDNDQVFEVRADKLKDLAPTLAEIRDARLARFKADDVRKLEIDWKGKSLVLLKDKDKWRLEKPYPVDAETQPITELLDKLAGLEARGPEIRDREDLKNVGLDKPIATVTLSLEETKKTDKAARSLTYSFGETAKDKGKLFVRLADWPRVNVLNDDLVKLLDRDALAYRRRRLLDQAGADLAKIEIRRGADSFAFERKEGVWSQTAPSPAKIESDKVEQLAGDLARLETAEFVVNEPKGEELDKSFGLAKPEIMVTLTFADAKEPSRTLKLGKPRVGKDDSFARLDDGPIFALKKDIRELIDRDALSYRPAQAWQVQAENIAELRIKKAGEAFSVSKDAGLWRVTGPFTAHARPDYVEAIADELAQLKSEKYVAQIKNDLAKFGLDKPYLEIEVISRGVAKLTPAGKEKGKETTAVLQIGKLDEAAKSRFARIGDGDAVFLVSEKTLAFLDRGPLDFLDRVLAKVNVPAISQIRFQGKTPFTLEKKKDLWQVVGSPAPAFTAEDDVVQSTLRPWGNLLAEKIVAYGPNTDWAKFGLDKPDTTIIVSSLDDDKKSIEQTLSLGKDAGNGARFARMNPQQAVAVLDAAVVKELSRSYLDFVDPRVLKFAFDAVTRIDRTMKDGDFEIVKRDDAWQFAKPSKQPADTLTVDDIIEKSFRLKAERVAAYPAKDLEKFGLAPPVAVITLHLGDDKQHVLKIGDKVDNADGRFAIVDNGSAVVVLPGALARHLTAPVLYFADRNLASFGAADRLELTRGDRKATFAKAGATWKLTDPIKADAEESLGDFVQGLFRLRADEIVAGKDADLKEFGLAPPLAQWKVFAGDREMLDVLVGGAEKGKGDDGRRYARLAKGDQVFLLTPKQSAAALAEYRARKPWAPLDAAQIVQVAVTRDGANFTLAKRDGGWSVKDRPADKVNEKTVTDLLDALAGLKVDHFVADVGGNLQLFGLEPPTVKIDIATPAGARTLLLGRGEGDTGRLYAAVAGSDAVFVIGAADSSRLRRPLAAYVTQK
jgi:hypothetical protein